ncbi:MAG: EutN/CcmL family microcompartment protein [Pseudomonadota bacterium]
MKLGHVTGTVEASQKDASLSGTKLLLCDLVDGKGGLLVPAFVAVDACGAGVGDMVLITFNDAARMPFGAAGAATDATIIAVVDRVSMAGDAKPAARPAAAAKAATRKSATGKSAAKTPRNAKASNRRKS